MNEGTFELKTTDLGGRIGIVETKTSRFETPALLPVIHPVRQLVPCSKIKSMGYAAVMTNAYTTYRRLKDRASEGIHKIIGFEGTIMTDSGGYQVLEFGSVDIDPLQMAGFEEQIGSDIAIILDKPTGLEVTRKYATETVRKTLEAAKKTIPALTRTDMIWTLPIQGGRYVDIVGKSARESAKLDYGCYALGSPVEVMEEYDFSLLVEMIRASKNNLPVERPFHLFGAGHPLVIPLAVALGCDMFDSASYMLYARSGRYISSGGTIRLEQLEYLPCSCPVCSSLRASELKTLKFEEQTMNLATHNLYVLKEVIEETKQAIWEGRLWEYVRAKCANHPLAFKAFKSAVKDPGVDVGTPDLKDRGIFLSDETDLLRPEIKRYFKKIGSVDLSGKDHLVIVPEPRTKPFLTSDIFNEVQKMTDPQKTLVAYVSSIFGVVPSEVSDIFPVSQLTQIVDIYPKEDYVIKAKHWKRIDLLVRKEDESSNWVKEECRKLSSNSTVSVSTTYRALKKKLSQV